MIQLISIWFTIVWNVPKEFNSDESDVKCVEDLIRNYKFWLTKRWKRTDKGRVLFYSFFSHHKFMSEEAKWVNPSRKSTWNRKLNPQTKRKLIYNLISIARWFLLRDLLAFVDVRLDGNVDEKDENNWKTSEVVITRRSTLSLTLKCGESLNDSNSCRMKLSENISSFDYVVQCCWSNKNQSRCFGD